MFEVEKIITAAHVSIPRTCERPIDWLLASLRHILDNRCSEGNTLATRNITVSRAINKEDSVRLARGVRSVEFAPSVPLHSRRYPACSMTSLLKNSQVVLRSEGINDFTTRGFAAKDERVTDERAKEKRMETSETSNYKDNGRKSFVELAKDGINSRRYFGGREIQIAKRAVEHRSKHRTCICRVICFSLWVSVDCRDTRCCEEKDPGNDSRLCRGRKNVQFCFSSQRDGWHDSPSAGAPVLFSANRWIRSSMCIVSTSDSDVCLYGCQWKNLSAEQQEQRQTSRFITVLLDLFDRRSLAWNHYIRLFALIDCSDWRIAKPSSFMEAICDFCTHMSQSSDPIPDCESLIFFKSDTTAVISPIL
ncbi:hypothetical protein ARMSODRAFT_982853 [Armillaria solidipes]|uniref:Uncharacterized protein n=1 Tax=Armillaria solidipes TaxID=1076256 RepID=A0A2H3B9D6_9AGAR|nr:hypothetical protein ARMSODRAFT_982853 [Armillaria solidipes]